ncbi:MAG TPA: ABC transporter ATP-binding protein, partial [Pararhizobium sp.]|nr:ABC transporter ATP-binding protein [Pararhizobium sp.]
VVQTGTPEELFEAPAHVFVGYFIGSPGMNFLDAEVAGDRATLAGGSVVALGGRYAPAAGRIGIRPEYATLTEGEGLALTIGRVEDIGRHRIVRGEVAGSPLDIVVPEGIPIPQSPRVHFTAGKVNVYVDDWRVAPDGEA